MGYVCMCGTRLGYADWNTNDEEGMGYCHNCKVKTRGITPKHFLEIEQNKQKEKSKKDKALFMTEIDIHGDTQPQAHLENRPQDTATDHSQPAKF